MELKTIGELIATLGFPIVCVIGLAVFVYKIWQQNAAREEKLMAEISENTEINKKFAEIIQRYEITLGEIKTDVKDIKGILNFQHK